MILGVIETANRGLGGEKVKLESRSGCHMLTDLSSIVTDFVSYLLIIYIPLILKPMLGVMYITIFETMCVLFICFKKKRR